MKHRFLSLFFAFLTLCGAILPASVARANARIVAVFVLRSTAAEKSHALHVSKEVAQRIAAQEGWDAKVISASGKGLGEQAAAAGAQVYVVGQVNGVHVTLASFTAATDERIADASFDLSGDAVPSSENVATLLAKASASSPAGAGSNGADAGTIAIPSGDLVSVMITGDIGSRISQEGDTFAVVTVGDYYYKGHLVLPKGSPGYGVITHLKRAGSFHAGGELNFTVKRLVTPSGRDLLVETNGATADADKQTEQNGNAIGQYLLWGWGVFAKRGNDILIKKGATFHVSTQENPSAPVSPEGALPAHLDETLVSAHG